MKLQYLPLLLLLASPTLIAEGWITTPSSGCQALATYDWISTEELAGGTWQGGCKNGRANGQGVLIYKLNGKGILLGTYEGNMENGNRHGQGKDAYPNGDRYEGQYKDGRYDGQGVFVWKDGSRYEGAWKNGKQNGLGRHTKVDGSLFHEGQWEDGSPVRVAVAPAPAPARSTACDHFYVGKVVERNGKGSGAWLWKGTKYRVEGVSPTTGRVTVKSLVDGNTKELGCGDLLLQIE